LNKKITLLFIFIISNIFDCVAQKDSLSSQNILISSFEKKNQKVKTLRAINIGLYGGSMTLLYQTWYKKYPQSKFHTFNDFSEWQQMDKAGHLYSAYTMSNYASEIWKQTGIDQRKRIWIGGLAGVTYQTVIEVLDGFSSEWGWSWGDIGANVLGSTFFIAQELKWNQQKFHLKTSFHKKNYDDASLNRRSDDLFGQTLAERSLKDYNGQTYWISADVQSIFHASKVPTWLQISFGTGAEGMFGANANISKDNAGNIGFNRTDIKRFRQWYLAPDINLTKIKTKHKSIKTALFILNALKFPTPAIEYSNSAFHWKWMYF
jgi:hypothetical protein